MTDRPDPDPFFIGWEGHMHPRDRRGFLVGAFALIAGGGAAGYGFGRYQARGGYGQWEMGATLRLTGELIGAPYPHLRVPTSEGGIQSVLLATTGKCGGQDHVQGISSARVTVTGSPIVRGQHLMLALSDGADAVIPAETGGPDGPVRTVLHGPVESRATILDAKCFLGAMRPQEAKTHKACAALCIRGGIPAMVYLPDVTNGPQLALLADGQGFAHGEGILPLVADPLMVSGTLISRDDLAILQAPLRAMRRL